MIARWESRTGKYWVELYQHVSGYRYAAPGCGGWLYARTEAEAIEELQRKIDTGYFLPDSAKTPMKRVK